MEELGYWKHEAPDGMSPFVWLSARDYPYATAGENLATGFETVGVLTDSWMESPGHRANILASKYEDVGIAVIDGATTRRSVGKSVVVLFGSVQRQVTVAATVSTQRE
ncbi:MAG TPA: CAP domain-containing protein, partial [Thermoanaerobaculia bacterium]|nr:CAP domain-containing protein [Thermoanaerobaculia bacterium]